MLRRVRAGSPRRPPRHLHDIVDGVAMLVPHRRRASTAASAPDDWLISTQLKTDDTRRGIQIGETAAAVSLPAHDVGRAIEGQLDSPSDASRPLSDPQGLRGSSFSSS